ncbi:MAG: DNA internalization-related competence protein ComEC/Rec2, partial [Pseudomonadales bacterium]|nr:DNA internalization-related competence protein ComEC/Rec2 [Pseudomonadales bacterium]
RVPGLLIALMLGESSYISPEEWKILSDTGTNHLFIISGLHVGLVTAAFYRLALLVVGRRSAAMVSLLLAFLYGMVAGMGLPVQRALIMTSVAVLGATARRNVPVPDLYCYALLGVTLVDPLAMLSSGFWLSFGAVFSLLYVFAGRTGRDRSWLGWLMTAIGTQWVVFIGMLPWLLYLVFQVSLVSFLVNLVAIPWIGILVVPPLLLAMFGVISDGLFALLLGIANGFLELIWQLLSRVAEQRLVFFAGAIDTVCLVSGVLGSIVLLSPKGFVPRWPGVILMVPLFTVVPDRPAEGELEMTVLDVGQGLSVFMRTHDGAVLYDAGPRFGDRFDAGEQIVVPTVRRSGISRLQAFVISHTDMDHAGGAAAVLANLPAGRVYVSEVNPGPGAVPCNRDESWELDGVLFRIIAADRTGSGTNNRSCIMLVKGRGYTVLLPGDIERSVETRLAVSVPRFIDVLLAPHHGSRSSSSPGFLNHVMADTVIVSAGYRNRFNHPDPGVVRRYLARNARVLSTAEAGAIKLRLGNGVREIELARVEYPRYWYD